MILSASQIAQVAAAAGFSGPDLVTAVAVALAESNPPGNTASYNPETQAGAPQGQGSYGLWQIFLAAHPEFAGEDLTDPQTNANAAYSIYAVAGNNFTPWSTYNSGKFRSYLATAAAAVAPAVPLTLDAATGMPVSDAGPTPPPLLTPAEIAAGTFIPPGGAIIASPSFTQVLFWGIIGIGTLWLFSETF